MDSTERNQAEDQERDSPSDPPRNVVTEIADEADLGESPKGISLSAPSPKTTVANKRAFFVVLTVLLLALALVAAGIIRKGQTNAATKQIDSTPIYPSTNQNSADSLVTSLEETHKQTHHATGSKTGSGTLQPPPIEPGAPDATTVPLVHRPATNGAASKTNQAAQATQPYPPSPEEQARQEAYDEEQQARKTPLSANSATTTGTNGPALSYPGAPPAPPTANLADLAGALRGGGNNVSPESTTLSTTSRFNQHNSTADYQGENQQDEKDRFLKKAASRPEDDTLPHTRVAPIAEFLLAAGSRIPATLDVQGNSDLPGEITGRVRENVYDARFGERHLLIPQGAHVIGEYNSHLTYGQGRVQVAWDRILYPDGSSIQLGGMNGEDSTGASGLKGRVNNHYGRLIADAALTSGFAAAIALTQRQNTSLLATPTVGNTISQAIGQQLGELGQETTRRNLNRQPTIQLPPGMGFDIYVNRDIAFVEPYKPMESNRQ